MFSKRIVSSNDLKEAFRPDKKTRFRDANGRNFACTTVVLQFTAFDKRQETDEWFINSENELIFNLKENYFVNLDMFDEGESTMRNCTAYWTIQPELEKQITLF